MAEFHTDVYAAEDVAKATKSVNAYERRNFTNLIRYFLDMPTEPRICIIYGFQGTGKTTAIFQAIQDMTENERKQAVYITAKPDNTTDDLCKDLHILYNMGRKIIFIEEITEIKDFIDSSSLLSDIYAAMGMKIIVTGDDSFSFWLAENDQLYDRAYEIHTTPMPIEEYARIIGKEDIDEYIKYGGILGEKSEYENAIQNYLDDAVIKNMQYSVGCCKYGIIPKYISDLHKENKLEDELKRFIYELNCGFLLDVLTRDVRINDIPVDDLKKTQETQNEEDIKRCLKGMNFIYPIECYNSESGETTDYFVLTQPCVRYHQVCDILHSLINEQADTYSYIIDRIKRRIFADSVIMETRKNLSRERYYVCKLNFPDGAIDMVIYDHNNYESGLYTVNFGTDTSLTNAEKCAVAEWRYRQVVRNTALYPGKSYVAENGIEYKNIWEFLKELTEGFEL